MSPKMLANQGAKNLPVKLAFKWHHKAAIKFAPTFNLPILENFHLPKLIEAATHMVNLPWGKNGGWSPVVGQMQLWLC